MFSPLGMGVRPNLRNRVLLNKMTLGNKKRLSY